MGHSGRFARALLINTLQSDGVACSIGDLQVSVVNLPFTVTAAQLVMLFQPFVSVPCCAVTVL